MIWKLVGSPIIKPVTFPCGCLVMRVGLMGERFTCETQTKAAKEGKAILQGHEVLDTSPTMYINLVGLRSNIS